MRIAIYAGTFDPITLGHAWMIEQGSTLFDRLIVAIGNNPQKKTMFSLEERFKMLEKDFGHFSNIVIESFDNRFLISYAHQRDAKFILRGIRNENDYRYEHAMRNINDDIGNFNNPYKSAETIFMIPPRELAEVSSSMVKGLIGPQGWEGIVSKYVSGNVFKKIESKHGNR